MEDTYLDVISNPEDSSQDEFPLELVPAMLLQKRWQRFSSIDSNTTPSSATSASTSSMKRSVSISDVGIKRIGRKLMITMPCQTNLTVAVLEKWTNQLASNWVKVEVDLQGSRLSGWALDSMKLCSNPHCDFVFDNGIFRINTVCGFNKQSLFRSIHFQSNSSPMVFNNSSCIIENCTSTGGLHMFEDCNVKVSNSIFQENSRDSLVVDRGSEVSAVSCEFSGTGKIGIKIQNGGRGRIDKCVFSSTGIEAKSSGSFCDVRNSIISGPGAEVTVHHGAHLVSDSTIIADCTGNGVTAWGRGTRANLSSCEIRHTGSHGISVKNGAHLAFLNSKCMNALECGILVKGPGAKLKCQSSQILACNSGGVWVGERGTALVLDSCIVGSSNGPGIMAEGYATEVNVIGSRLSQHKLSSIVLRKGVFARLKQVCSLASGTAHALEVHDEGTIAQVTDGEFKSQIESPIIKTSDAIVVYF